MIMYKYRFWFLSSFFFLGLMAALLKINGYSNWGASALGSIANVIIFVALTYQKELMEKRRKSVGE
jgi:hypothetical protein